MTTGRWTKQADGKYLRESTAMNGRVYAREWVTSMPECDCSDPACDGDHSELEAQLETSLALAKAGLRRFPKAANR